MAHIAQLIAKYTKLLFLTLLAVLLLTSIGGFYLYYQQTILSFASIPTAAHDKSISTGSPTRISIPSANIDLAVETGSIKNGVWKISQENASFLDVSAKPGTEGNIVIYGHNKKSIFGNLNKVSMDDLIILEIVDGNILSYEVETISTVKPTQVEVIVPTDYEVLTVYTCNGFLDSTRLVIKAKPILIDN